MSIDECDVFSYTKVEMELHLSFITCFDAPKIKEIIDNLVRADDETKKNIYRRVLKCKMFQDWWQTENEKSLAIELTHIWKVCRKLMSWFYESEEDGIDGKAYRDLSELEKELEDDKINEQQYIVRCNQLRDTKNREEKILDACPCSLLGNINECVSEEDDGTKTHYKIFRVMCLPCGWSGACVV
jgi:hypothetical protein